MANKKRFFASHAKSSAAVVSLVIHGILILIAFTFVAVTVITKEDKRFEARPVARPQMQLKKLQVPVTIKKKRPDPKLRKRIVAKPKTSQNMPDIKMPEITGIAGGIGGAGGGLGDGSALGFSMPEIEIFGIKGKGKGEKVVLILDAGSDMMLDELGGITAYNLIKEELVRIVDELPSAALFNVIVYEYQGNTMAFPDLVPATDANTRKMREWLMPLNAVKVGMGANEYGMKTIGKGGVYTQERIVAGKFADLKSVKGVGELDTWEWYKAVMFAQKMQADTIFVLTQEWGHHRVPTSERGSREEWNQTAAGRKWNAAYREALQKLDEENRKRAAANQPPKVIPRDEWNMAHEYYDDLERPPQPDWYYFTPQDFAQAFSLVRSEYKPKDVQTKSGLGQKKSKEPEFSFNVIQFVAKGAEAPGNDIERFKVLTGLCKGEYRTIAGLEAIQNLVK